MVKQYKTKELKLTYRMLKFEGHGTLENFMHKLNICIETLLTTFPLQD